jgi:hypothetical protein
VTILPQTLDQLSGRRLNNIAVASSRHQAILHFAARGQLVSHHSPTTNNTTAIARPAIAARRFPPCSGSFIVRRIPETVEVNYPGAAARYYHFSAQK